MDTLPAKELIPGLRLCAPGIGTAPLGGLYQPASFAQGVALLRRALDGGARYFDSALYYGGGQALEILGAALGPDPGRHFRDLVISFKVGRVFVSGPADPLAEGKQLHAVEGFPACTRKYVYDYSAAGVRLAFEHSFDAMNRGRAARDLSPLSPADLAIILFVHDPGVAEHGAKQAAIFRQVLTESFPELLRMQREGLIRAYGVGTNEIEPCIAALEDPGVKLLMLAGQGTLLSNGAPAAPEEIQSDTRHLDRLLSALSAHPNRPKLAIAAIGNSGLAYGGSTFKYAPAPPEIAEFRDRLLAAVREFSQGDPVSITQLLIEYPFAAFGEAVATVVPGPGSPAELDSLLEAARAAPVARAIWDHLAAKGLIRRTLCGLPQSIGRRAI